MRNLSELFGPSEPYRQEFITLLSDRVRAEPDLRTMLIALNGMDAVLEFPGEQLKQLSRRNGVDRWSKPHG